MFDDQAVFMSLNRICVKALCAEYHSGIIDIEQLNFKKFEYTLFAPS